MVLKWSTSRNSTASALPERWERARALGRYSLKASRFDKPVSGSSRARSINWRSTAFKALMSRLSEKMPRVTPSGPMSGT